MHCPVIGCYVSLRHQLVNQLVELQVKRNKILLNTESVTGYSVSYSHKGFMI